MQEIRKNIEPILQQIEEYRILTISNSMDLTSYKTNCRIARNSKYVIPAFGIHPWNAHKYLDKIELIEKLIGRTEIIGEIGLDYFYVKDKVNIQHRGKSSIYSYQRQRIRFCLFTPREQRKTFWIC